MKKVAWRFFTNPDYPLIIHHTHDHGEFHKFGKKSTNLEQFNSGVVNAFICVLIDNREVPIPGIEGYKALQAVLACKLSAETGQVVSL